MKHRPEASEQGRRGVWARSLVGGHLGLGHKGLAGLRARGGVGYFHRDQLFVKLVGSTCCNRLPVAVEGKDILVFARDLVTACNPLGGQAHGKKRGGGILPQAWGG